MERSAFAGDYKQMDTSSRERSPATHMGFHYPGQNSQGSYISTYSIGEPPHVRRVGGSDQISIKQINLQKNMKKY